MYGEKYIYFCNRQTIMDNIQNGIISPKGFLLDVLFLTCLQLIPMKWYQLMK